MNSCKEGDKAEFLQLKFTYHISRRLKSRNNGWTVLERREAEQTENSTRLNLKRAPNIMRRKAGHDTKGGSHWLFRAVKVWLKKKKRFLWTRGRRLANVPVWQKVGNFFTKYRCFLHFLSKRGHQWVKVPPHFKFCLQHEQKPNISSLSIRLGSYFWSRG